MNLYKLSPACSSDLSMYMFVLLHVCLCLFVMPVCLFACLRHILIYSTIKLVSKLCVAAPLLEYCRGMMHVSL